MSLDLCVVLRDLWIVRCAEPKNCLPARVDNISANNHSLSEVLQIHLIEISSQLGINLLQ